jgi:hypothetical protein
MSLGSTQLLTEISKGKGRPARKADNLTAIFESIVWRKCGDPRRLTTLWALTAGYRDSFTFFYYYYYYQTHNSK